MKRKISAVILSVLFVMIFTGCQKDDPIDPPQPVATLVAATPLGTYSRAELTQRADSIGYGAFSSLIDYDVAYYRIIYRLQYDGRSVQASGLLGIPQGMDAPSLLCTQHGTMFRDADAPSNFPHSYTGFPLMASIGYITLVPDYVGLGISKNTPQTYYDQASSGRAVVDMIRAVKEFLAQQQITTSGRLFLFGYSEGGYVTLAAQKEIETNPALNLKVTAVAAGAGGYNLPVFMAQVLQDTTYPAPSFLALIVTSYNDAYGWDRPLTDYFRQPYATMIPELLNGSYTREQIDAQLTDTLADLFNPDFLATLQIADPPTAFKEKMRDNSILSWVPECPTRLFHGTDDRLVPFETTQVTYDRFEAAGATNVQLIPIPGGTHVTSVLPMMMNVLPWFNTLDQ